MSQVKPYTHGWLHIVCITSWANNQLLKSKGRFHRTPVYTARAIVPVVTIHKRCSSLLYHVNDIQRHATVSLRHERLEATRRLLQLHYACTDVHLHIIRPIYVR